MADTYFNYVLSQCRIQRINSVCDVVSTRKALEEMANSAYNGCNNITADWRLLETVKICLDNYEIIDPNSLDRDSLDIYNRCRTIAFSDGSINYDCLFDMLVEFNWLQASINNAKKEQTKCVELLSDPIMIQYSLKEYLLGVYTVAVQDWNEYVFISEAIQARRKLFTGIFPFKYEESKYYISPDFSFSELESLQHKRRESSHKRIALFFGLTATAARAEDIIRRLCW